MRRSVNERSAISRFPLCVRAQFSVTPHSPPIPVMGLRKPQAPSSFGSHSWDESVASPLGPQGDTVAELPPMPPLSLGESPVGASVLGVPDGRQYGGAQRFIAPFDFGLATGSADEEAVLGAFMKTLKEAPPLRSFGAGVMTVSAIAAAIDRLGEVAKHVDGPPLDEDEPVGAAPAGADDDEAA